MVGKQFLQMFSLYLLQWRLLPHWHSESKLVLNDLDCVLRTFYSHFNSQENRAVRLVIDEAHQLLSQLDFRTQWPYIQKLADLPVQKIFITASLPRRHELQFKMEAGLKPSTQIIRACSAQPFISYNKVKYSSTTTTPLRLIISIATYLEREGHVGDDDIGIIFCQSKSQVDQLNEFTKCSSYGGHPDRGSNEMAWKAGEKKWIAATTGMIHGIDAPNVSATIFWGMPYGLLNLYQGSGRGGRGGHVSLSIVVYASDHYLMIGDLPKEDLECRSEGEAWLSSNECRRLEFSRMLDGDEQTCNDTEDCYYCDFCDDDTELIDGLKALVIDPPRPGRSLTTLQSEEHSKADQDDMEVDEEDEYDTFALDLMNYDFEGINNLQPVPKRSEPLISVTGPRVSGAPSIISLENRSYYHKSLNRKFEKARLLDDMVTMLEDSCVVCWAWNGKLTPRHEQPFLQCKPDHGRLEWMNGWIDLKKSLTFAKYEVCFKCQLPQGRNYIPSKHKPLGAGPNPCHIGDFVIQLVWFIRHHRPTWEAAVDAFSALQDDMGLDAFREWLNRTDGLECFWNGVELILWLKTYRDKNE
jgi:hypothetical protein